MCRFQLPPNLPPSFKGVAARYIYSLDACLTYANPIPTPTQPASDTASAAGPSSQQASSLLRQPSRAVSEAESVSVPASPRGVPSPHSIQERPSRLGFLGQPRGSSSGPALANGHGQAGGTGGSGKGQQLRVLKEVAVRLPLTIWPPPVSTLATLRIQIAVPPSYYAEAARLPVPHPCDPNKQCSSLSLCKYCMRGVRRACRPGGGGGGGEHLKDRPNECMNMGKDRL